MPDQEPCKEVKPPAYWMGILLLVIPTLLWIVAWLSGNRAGLLGLGPWSRPGAFGVTMLLLAAFCLVVGKAVTGLWRGLLIDNRNRISLSRFQTAVWTVVVLAAILVAAFSNLTFQAQAQGKDPNGNPLPADPVQAKKILGLPDTGPIDFAIPEELWIVLGISVTSLIGSPLILNTKKDQPPTDAEAQRTSGTLRSLGDNTVVSHGQILVRTCPENARWTDLFQAEEVGNGAHLDLAKVQNFYFTLILVFAYAYSLFEMFGTKLAVKTFPELSEGMVALLAISHAAYLANKARPHTQTPDPAAPDAATRTMGRVDSRVAPPPSTPAAPVPPVAPVPTGP